MFLHIPHDVFKFVTMRPYDHMDMARHDAPAVYFEAFISLAMPPRVEHDVLVFVTDKKVDPIYDRKADEIKFILISEFIFGAHYSLKVHR
jgi:hypothetical protein